MSNVVRTHVANIFNGRDRAYIYIWLSKQARAVYVGQTAGSTGSLGRGHAHFRTQGQLRRRMDQKLGVDPEDFDDFLLTSYLLPVSQEFIGPESSYREAVEYLVQSNLQQLRGGVRPGFRIISWVRSNDRTSDLGVQLLAQDIVADFLMSY
ncbi:MAG: hypothetical protein M3Y54_12465 [Bacteroidota bacterium]|nr:hypothetical protein [Bacteroidota bacterium]